MFLKLKMYQTQVLGRIEPSFATPSIDVVSLLKYLKVEDDAFPNIKILLTILTVLPVTTKSFERLTQLNEIFNFRNLTTVTTTYEKKNFQVVI